MSESIAIMTHGLRKSYGKVHALRNLDLEVKQGEIFGFLGPNGAGKTTTIRCLLDLIRPDDGYLRVCGIDPQADSVNVRSLVGYLPGELQRMAALIAGVVLVVSFFLEGLSQLTDKLDQVVKFSPLHYYQSGNAINGIKITWVVGLLITTVIFAFAAWLLFKRRDIRVSGEGSWDLSTLFFWRKAEV